MWQRLLDENTWHGKFIKGVVDTPKVAVVLVFFAGAFAVIAWDVLVARLRHGPPPRRSLRERAGLSLRLK